MAKFKGFPDMSGKFEPNEPKKNSGNNNGGMPDNFSSFNFNIGGTDIDPSDFMKVIGLSAGDLGQMLGTMFGAMNPGQNSQNPMAGLFQIGGNQEEEEKRIFDNSSLRVFEDSTPLQNSLCVNPHPEKKFFRCFGVKDSYSSSDLIGHIEAYFVDEREKLIVDNIDHLDFVEATTNFILLKAYLNDGVNEKTEESFYVALVNEVGNQDDLFNLIVPRFGNSVIETSEPKNFFIVNKEDFENLYDEDIIIESVTDVEKIKAELSLILYNNEKKSMILSEAGTIVQYFKDPESSSNTIRVGSIMLKESEKITQFLKDFSLSETQKKFNFYVELEDTCSRGTLKAISNVLDCFDFNKAEIIQNSEVYPVKDGLGIKLNLESFEDNIIKWGI